MNKVIIFVIVLLIIIVGGYFLMNQAQAPVVTSAPTPSTPVTVTLPEYHGVLQIPVGPRVVTYTDSGYSPSTLTIKKGETVVFKNNSTGPMWTASANHPTHTLYPTTGGCLGSTFDACVGIAPGGEWSFQFDFVGTWGYHDHLRARNQGTIVVE